MDVNQLKAALLSIRMEKEDIARMKYNARWEKVRSPELREALVRHRQLVAQEKETVLLLKQQHPPRAPQPHVVAQPTLIRPLITITQTLSAEELDKPLEDFCGICMDEHTRRDSIHTSCGHDFGRMCYERYSIHNTNINVNAGRIHRCTPCPMCRNATPELTVYIEE